MKAENVFVDRAVEWTGQVCATVTVLVTAPVGKDIMAGTSLQGLIAPAAFPLHQSVTQMSATINDATVTTNTQDVLPQILRLADMRDARRQRTCPTMLDRYAVQPDTNTVRNSPLQVWSQSSQSDEVPNGGFNGFYYAESATGSVPQPFSGLGTPVGGVAYYNGQPYVETTITSAAPVTLTFHVVLLSTEKLLLSPFIFSDQYEMSTGLFGVQNFQVQMNLAPSPKRALRVATELSVVSDNGDLVRPFSLTNTVWSATGAYGGLWVSQPKLSVIFLSPAIETPLPPKSIVPYMDFSRYIGTPGDSVPESRDILAPSFSLTSQTITLPSLPDLLVIYVKPSSYADATNGDWSLPITSISLNFDNFSGLMSTMTQKQLYQMSVRNGVDMDWSEWSGLGNVPFNNSLDVSTFTLAAPLAGGQRGLIGGPLVLKPGVDFPLQTGQASGLVGNFTLQFSIGVQNFTGAARTPNIYTVPITSGFFETIKGSSRIVRSILTEQDILSSPAQAPSESSARPVGAGRGGRSGMPVRGGMSGYVV